MSKQSNQKYRKEKDKSNGDRADIGTAAANPSKNRMTQDKINREFDAPSGKTGQ